VQFADQVVTLKAGRVVEVGSPAALAEKDGYFARSLQMQILETKETGHG
jgi:ABC-type multidrug transport system fused ATPase/permease subunit